MPLVCTYKKKLSKGSVQKWPMTNSHAVWHNPNHANPKKKLFRIAHLNPSEQALPFFPIADGEIHFTKGHLYTERELEAKFPEVKHGGHWSPSNCRPKQAIVVVIPFRYESHL